MNITHRLRNTNSEKGISTTFYWVSSINPIEAVSVSENFEDDFLQNFNNFFVMQNNKNLNSVKNPKTW